MKTKMLFNFVDKLLITSYFREPFASYFQKPHFALTETYLRTFGNLTSYSQELNITQVFDMDKQLNIVTSITFLTVTHNINIILTTVDMWITRILSIFINFRYCKYFSKYLRITGVFIKCEFTDI